MSKNDIESFYQDLIKYSWDDSIDDYVELIFNEGKKYATNNDDLQELIDVTLKRILSELESKVPSERYNNLIMNLGSYNDQDSYDFTIGLIQTYYINKFVLEGEEYTVFGMMKIIIDQHKTENTLPDSKTFHYMLAILLRIHHALYLREVKK